MAKFISNLILNLCPTQNPYFSRPQGSHLLFHTHFYSTFHLPQLHFLTHWTATIHSIDFHYTLTFSFNHNPVQHVESRTLAHKNNSKTAMFIHLSLGQTRVQLFFHILLCKNQFLNDKIMNLIQTKWACVKHYLTHNEDFSHLLQIVQRS